MTWGRCSFLRDRRPLHSSIKVFAREKFVSSERGEISSGALASTCCEWGTIFGTLKFFRRGLSVKGRESNANTLYLSNEEGYGMGRV